MKIVRQLRTGSRTNTASFKKVNFYIKTSYVDTRISKWDKRSYYYFKYTIL